MATHIPAPPAENTDPWFSQRDAFDQAVRTRLNDELSDAQLNATIAAATRHQVRPVVLLGAGQSNSEGRALPVSDLLDPADSRILMYDWDTEELTTATVPLSSRQTQLGLAPITVAARRMVDSGVPGVVLVSGGVGGSTLAGDGASGVWRVDYTGTNPALYAPFRDAAISAIAQATDRFGVAPDVVMFWNQGEADSNASAYFDAFNALVAQLRTDLGDSGLPVVIGGIVPEYIGIQPNRAPIRDVLMSRPGHLARIAYVDGIPGGGGSQNPSDIVHYSRSGMEALGNAMYEAIPYAIVNIGSTPLPPLKVTATVGAGTLSVAWQKPLCRVNSYLVEVNVDGSGWVTVPHGTLATTLTTWVGDASGVRVRVSCVNTSGTSAPAYANAIMGQSPRPGFVDTFDRGDGPVAVTDDGKAWTVETTSGNPYPLWVTSGAARRGFGGSAARTLWTVDALTGDGTLKATIGAIGDATGVLVFRYVNPENHLALLFRASASILEYRLAKREGGTQTTLASAGSAVSASGDVIEVNMVGDQITVSVNGSPLFGGARTEAFQQTATRHGLLLQAASDGTDRLADIEFTPA